MPGAKALSVLVIEDEVLISMLLEDMLDEAGCTIVGPCPSVDEAMSVLDGQAFDVALVDGQGRVAILENAFGDCFA